MGGGGNGALMSGRGAADALARMTMVAGGFFLVTSFGLTILSGSASSLATRSVFDTVPAAAQHGTTTTAPAPVLPAAPTPVRPDPTQSSAPQAADRQLVSLTPGPAPAAAAPIAPAASNASTHAAPIVTPPANNRPATTVPASTNAASAATRPPATAPVRTSAPATATPTRATNATTSRPLILPNTSGSAGGITLTDDPPISTESNDAGVQAVRRERAGPDQ